jgi:hypothetical protein
MNKNKIQVCLLSILLLFCLNTPALAQTHVGSTYSGPEAQIKQFLCTPSDASTSKDKASNDLYNCINRIYRFALVTASFFAVFMIVLAGWVYMSAEGNEESVTKAKDILVTSIASIVILSSGYVLLKFINPDLIQFQPIQPPSVVGVKGYSFNSLWSFGTTGTGSGGNGQSIQSYILAGYDIGLYATDPNHESAITGIYTYLKRYDLSSPNAIEQYIRRLAPNSPLTGQMVYNSATKYKVDVNLMIALMQFDSFLGTKGKGANSNNPGNVGSTSEGSIYDSGSRTTRFPDWQSGVNAVAEWLSKHRA